MRMTIPVLPEDPTPEQSYGFTRDMVDLLPSFMIYLADCVSGDGEGGVKVDITARHPDGRQQAQTFTFPICHLQHLERLVHSKEFPDPADVRKILAPTPALLADDGKVIAHVDIVQGDMDGDTFDLIDDITCREEGCQESTVNGEGYDGRCGNCADIQETLEDYEEEETDDG